MPKNLNLSRDKINSLQESQSRECGSLGFLDCLPTSLWNLGKANASFGVRQTGNREPALGFSCVCCAKSLNLSESQGSWAVNGKHGSLLCRLAQLKSLSDSQAHSRPPVFTL